MILAMMPFKASSDNIAKIIKTIDEIAFQTNIPALHACRRGRPGWRGGYGFAVVAEEVRSLAQRSAPGRRERPERNRRLHQKRPSMGSRSVPTVATISRRLRQHAQSTNGGGNRHRLQEQSQGISRSTPPSPRWTTHPVQLRRRRADRQRRHRTPRPGRRPPRAPSVNSATWSGETPPSPGFAPGVPQSAETRHTGSGPEAGRGKTQRASNHRSCTNSPPSPPPARQSPRAPLGQNGPAPHGRRSSRTSETQGSGQGDA